MSRNPQQLGLFDAPLPPREPRPAPAPAAPPPAPPDLFNARSTLLAPVVAALADGRFDDAASLARAVPGEATLAERIAQSTEFTDDSASVVAAFRRGTLVAEARRLDALDPCAAARTWLDARRPVEARRALEQADSSAPALVMLANLLLAEGDVRGARERYRRAFWLDSGAISLDTLDDAEVAAAVEEEKELAPEPHAEWVPLVGIALKLWDSGGCEARDAASPPARFHAALQRSRSAAVRGKPDIGARRELRALAPKVFARLMEEGLA